MTTPLSEPLAARAKALKLHGLLAHWEDIATAAWVTPTSGASDRHGERSEAGRPPVGVGRGRAAAVAKGPLGPEAAKAVCKRIRDAVKPFAQGVVARRGSAPQGACRADAATPERSVSGHRGGRRAEGERATWTSRFAS